MNGQPNVGKHIVARLDLEENIDDDGGDDDDGDDADGDASRKGSHDNGLRGEITTPTNLIIRDESQP